MPESFKCPMCAAPLPFDGTAITVRCPYCTNTVIVPDELRKRDEPTPIPYHAAGGNIMDKLGQAFRLTEVVGLVKGGNKLEAIKVYREITGASLLDAKNAVERLERGEPITIQQTSVSSTASVTDGDQHSAAIGEVKRLLREGNKIMAIKVFREAFGVGLKEAKDAVEDIETGRPIAFAQTASGPQLIRPAEIVDQITANFPAKKAARGCGLGAGVVVIGVIGVVILAGFLITRSFRLNGSNNKPGATKPAFADEVLSFGEAGVGPGQFQDNRALTVDAQKRIYVGEFQGGRVQQFDANGKYLSEFQSDPNSAIIALTAGRANVIYVVHPSKIVKFDANSGDRIGEVPNLNGNTREFFSGAYAALDGTLYAIGSNSNIIRITRSGQVSTLINVRQKTGDDTDLEQLTVDGAGNIYALDGRSETVLKFGPTGNLITRFGGSGKGDSQLSSPSHLAVDGRGRVYVSDLGRGIRVFDRDGRWLAEMGPDHGVIFGIAFASANELVGNARNEHKVIKYRINK